MSISFADRHFKAIARTEAIQHGLAKNPKSAAVMMPGPEQICVREALETGLFDRKTIIYAAERDETTYRKIKKFLSQNFDEYYIVNDDISKLKIGHYIDYAFLDFCGELNHKNFFWLCDELFYKTCVNGSSVNFTFSTAHRNNCLMNYAANPDDDLRYAIDVSDKSLKKIIKPNGEWRVNNLSTPFNKKDELTVRMLASTFPYKLGYGHSTVDNIIKYKDSVLTMLMVSATIRNNLLFDVKKDKVVFGKSPAEKAAATRRRNRKAA